MAKSNGGIIGKSNKTSFGKCTVTSKTSSGNVCTQSGTRIVEVNVVAGGGAGGYNVGGGGGAGGFVRTEVNVCGSTQYPITVGGGGAGSGDSAPRNGGPGSNSVFDTTTATGGGGGAGYSCGSDGLPGGSGGGARGYTSCSPRAAGSGTACQGNDGGSLAAPKGIGGTGAGGGGAGGVGTNSACVGSPKSGCVAGGAGLASPINCTTYAAGGKGMADSSPGSSASANTGNGGDGGGNPNCAGAGGSGVVIVKELNKASGVWSMQSQMAAKQQGTWPKKLFSLNSAILMVAGGGGSSAAPSPGGGGGGGMILMPACIGATALTGFESDQINVVIGAGGVGNTAGQPKNTTNGNDTYIGDSAPSAILTAIAGGAGGVSGAPAIGIKNPGGSGGGGVGEGGTASSPFVNPGGCSTQASSMPAAFAPYGFGNAGGSGTSNDGSPDRQGGGGGGAGGAGQPSGSDSDGGSGKSVTSIFGCSPQPFYIANESGRGATATGIFAGGGAGRQDPQRTPNPDFGPNGQYDGGSGGGGGATTEPGPSSPGCNSGTGGYSGTVNSGGGGGSGVDFNVNQGVKGGPGGSGGSGYTLFKVPGPQVPTNFAVAPGTNTIVTQPCGAKVAVFTVSGTLTVS